MITRLRRAGQTFASRWTSSLILRVVTSVLVAAVLVLLGGGYMVADQAVNGIIEAKTASSATQAWVTLQRMQNQINSTDLRTESLLERLGQLADETGNQPHQYSVLIETGTTIYLSGGVLSSSIPEALSAQLASEPDSVWTTPTQIDYADGRHEPGISVAGNLVAPSGQLYPVYFLFPTTNEAESIAVVKRALWSTGGVLLLALGLIAFLVTRQVAIPVRQARDTASQIAQGDLDQRLTVTGNDEIAGLATAMNHMADTLQEQIVQLEDLSRVQRQFVSDVSHELRTPLTTMKMAGDVLYDNREDFDPVSERTTELLHSEIDRFDLMLNDLLEISRFDAGAATLNLDHIDIYELVAKEVEAYKLVASAAQTPFVLDKSGPTTVEADAARIRRIVRNLLGNAVAHGEGKPIQVRVAGDLTSVAVSVRDHGVGLAEDHVDKVFIRFWRADASRNRILGGTGLGLSIALEDARLHKGWLEAWGRPGLGACFRLTLPVNQLINLKYSPLPLVPDDYREDDREITTGGGR